MSSRKSGYLIGVILLAFAIPLPLAWFCYSEGFAAAKQVYFRWNNSSRYASKLSNAVFWRNQFVYLDFVDPIAENRSANYGREIALFSMDPETGLTKKLDCMISDLINENFSVSPKAFEDRLWLVDSRNLVETPPVPQPKDYELIDGLAQASSFEFHRTQSGYWAYPPTFRLNGRLALIDLVPDGLVVSTWTDDKLDVPRFVMLPDEETELTIGKTLVTFHKSPMAICIDQGARIHTFVCFDDRTFYREGLELMAESATKTAPYPETRGTIFNLDSSSISASALTPANMPNEISGWSIVREEPEQGSEMRDRLHNPYGMLVAGQPTVMIRDDVEPGKTVGHLYRFDGATWSKFATQEFPFCSHVFQVFTCRDSPKAYIVATTMTGVDYVYTVDKSGIRATAGPVPKYVTMPTIYEEYLGDDESLFNSLMQCFALTTIPLLGIWLMMAWSTKPDYGFGKQTVKLASVGRRGLAKLIDLAVILGSTAILGRVLTQGFDWDSLAEAIACHGMHASVRTAIQIMWILFVWVTVVCIVLTTVQGRWGLTPGKWLCGLRTLRTTLRPCGFARSLVRELMLYVDTCCLVCFAPAVLQVAFSDHRQRFGDRIADTIVIDVFI